MVAPSFNDRIASIKRTKLEFNQEKINRNGTYDNDDHGWIPFPDQIHYDKVLEEKSGLCTGMDAVSKTFVNYLNAHPVYIHPMSAFAGAWAGAVDVGGPWRPEHCLDELEEECKKYNILMRGIYAMNHVGGDLKIGLDLGWGGLLKKIRHYREFNQPISTEFYDGEERIVIALQNWIGRHIDYAREQAATETNPFIRQNLVEIAEMNEWLIDNPPRTLREAMQFLTWFQSIDRMYFMNGSLGQLDELLRPYYETDIAEGRIKDDDEVVWYTACLLFNDTHYSQIGGEHPADGHDIASQMSFLLLEGMHRLNIPSNIAFRVHDQLNEDLFDKCVEYLFEDGTGVCYSCSGGLNKGFMRSGYPEALARMRAKVGCNWTALPGIEYCLQDVTRICLAKPLLLALEDVMSAEDEKSMESLWERYTWHIRRSCDLIKDGLDWHLEYKHLNKPEIILNLFAHGPIERGMDMSHGGVDIVNMACDATALATAADSFAAIEQFVIQSKRLTWNELYNALQNNYSGMEDIRLMLKTVQRYGAGNTRADFWAKRISDLYSAIMGDEPTKKGYKVLPGIFSHGSVFMHGKNLPATPNGRYASDPISHSADPDPGFLPGGGTAPTAKANAVAGVTCISGNSTPLQIDIDSRLAQEMGGRDIIKAYIKTFNDMGGTLMNINVVSKQKILEAHKDPDKYPDLVVRVTGYSAFFKSLSTEYRQQVVDRWIAQD
jgi:formate C-acetyltransferase